MRPVSLRTEDIERMRICLGFVGENEHTRITIDATKEFGQYQTAAVSLTVCPPDAEAYPAIITRDGNLVIWDITDSDLVHDGDGEYQLSFTQGETVAKTYIGKIWIKRSLVPSGEIPEGIDDFLTRAGAALTAIPETINTALAEAEASGEFDGDDGFSPVVEITAISGGYSISITDATGTHTAQVLNGTPGTPGDDGYSPTVSITEITGGHRITITDKTGDHSADVMDGDDGVSPTVTVTTITGGHQVTITDATGDHTFNVMDGQSIDPSDYVPKTDFYATEMPMGSSDSTKVSEELSSVKSAINHITDKMQTVEIPASANKWNKNTAQVGYLHKNGTVYTGGSYDNFVYGSIGAVSEGDVLNFYKWYNMSSITSMTAQWVVCYDSNGDVLPDSGTSAVTTFTVPSGVANVSITINSTENQIAMALKNNASAPTEYIPYSEPETVYIASAEFIHEAFEQEAQEINDKVDAIYTAESDDQGKVLQAKTVVDGKVTEWDFVSNGSSPSGDYVTTDLMQKCEMKEFPKSLNLWDDAHKTPGWYHKNGNIYSYDGYYYYDIGAVSKDDVIDAYYYDNNIVYKATMYAIVCKDSNGTIITSASTESKTSFTVPEGVASITITLNNYHETTMIVKNIARPTEFIPYFEAYSCYVATPEFIKDALTSEIILNVPSKVYAVVGTEMNIYFENITEEWTKYHWDITCTKGKQMQRGYTITPVAGDVGDYTLTIRASIDENAYKEVTTTLVIAGSASASGVSVIVLGDSTTDNGMAVTKIHTDFEAVSTTVQTLGTRGTAPNNHEGRSGWKASDYLTVQSRDGVNNPFYNPSKSTFDAAYYFANSGVSVPDWFFVNLGVNDVFGYVNDAELNVWIPRILSYYDTIVDSLHEAEPGMKIGVCITIPPNDSQDAFGKAYNCGQTRDRCKRNNTIWASRLMEHFSDKEDEGVYVVPIHANLDTVYNMGMETLPVNARNTSVTYESPTANGGVHPVESGYWQIADVYTAFLKGNAD